LETSGANKEIFSGEKIVKIFEKSNLFKIKGKIAPNV
jgi:hypothetical protein